MGFTGCLFVKKNRTVFRKFVYPFAPLNRVVQIISYWNHDAALDMGIALVPQCIHGLKAKVKELKCLTRKILNSTASSSCHFDMHHKGLTAVRPTCLAYVDGRKHENISFRKIVLLLHPHADVPYSLLVA